MFAESWTNDTPEVVAHMQRGENFNLEGLPGTFDQISLILDSPALQGMWTNRLSGTIPVRSLGQWDGITYHVPESRSISECTG